ncbi:MAG: efflux RND transporter periplasmic adaptor subunit [Pirellulales bacterium]|nr:efflux RND transporter periplasmic adaptor subunit [Pirellulales bacterium]
MMSSTPSHPQFDLGWQQLEDYVDRLHELARTPIPQTEFYRQLLDGCVTALAAVGGAIWLPTTRGRLELCYQINLEQAVDREDAQVESAHRALLYSALESSEPQIVPPQSGSDASAVNPTDRVVILGAVRGADSSAAPHAVVELFMRTGNSPATEQGWQELLATVCQVATEFHVYEQLCALQSERGLHGQSLALLRRIHGTADLRQTAFEIANEGRRFVDGDRLSVVVRRGKQWKLLAASGVDRVEARADITKHLERLAERVASWGEPLDYQDSAVAGEELPGELADLVEHFTDQSHARRLVVVPVTLINNSDQQEPRHEKPSLVLVAEQFDTDETQFSCQRVVELAALCEPAIRQALWLDRFAMRTTLRWSDRWTRLTESWGLSRVGFVAAVLVACLAALVWVPCDFEIEAPATLVPIVERDVFATANGTVREVHAKHGVEVEQGDVLAVLDDPQLALESERVQGETATVRKRLEAIAVARTDREVREESSRQRFPLSAEAQQLEKQLASLTKQQEILKQRRAALTLRSPIAGKVITLDVQNLLRARPVERGQVLFTIADTRSGWRLEGEVSQDRIGHVLEAQHREQENLPVRFRLAGEVDQTFAGHLESVSAIAVLATDDLGSAPPAIHVQVAVDEAELLAARPGMSAELRIACGKRSLGYVWLHDVWETVYSWLVF